MLFREKGGRWACIQKRGDRKQKDNTVYYLSSNKGLSWSNKSLPTSQKTQSLSITKPANTGKLTLFIPLCIYNYINNTPHSSDTPCICYYFFFKHCMFRSSRSSLSVYLDKYLKFKVKM
jgi:hypothetical protein